MVDVVVYGLGYVGAVSIASLLDHGHRVCGVDPDVEKVALLLHGRPTVREEDVGDWFREGVRAGMLTGTTEPQPALVSIVAVGTPSAPDGGVDAAALYDVAEQIGTAMRSLPATATPLVILRSTALPHVVAEVVRRIETCSERTADRDFDLVVYPEFLREGSAMADAEQPPLTVFGIHEGRRHVVLGQLVALYGEPEAATTVIANRATAAFAKYACNAFHAVKVAFANEMAALAEASDVDGLAVMELLCRDRVLNVSAAYLTPGLPFGGSCLPKDLRALDHYARGAGVQAPLVHGTLDSNAAALRRVLELVRAAHVSRVGLVGLGFKCGTTDCRESPAVILARWLVDDGCDVLIHDPGLLDLDGARGTADYLRSVLPDYADRQRPLHRLVRDAEMVLIASADAALTDKVRAAVRRFRAPCIDLRYVPPAPRVEAAA